MNPFVVPFALTEMLVYIKSMGSSQSYVSIKRDKTGALDVRIFCLIYSRTSPLNMIKLQISKNNYR